MDILNSILSCLGAPAIGPRHLTTTTTHHILSKSPPYTTTPSEDATAAHILNTIFTSEKSPSALSPQFRTTNWTESLARRILDGIVSALESGKVLVGTMRETYDKVSEVAEEFVREHPVLTEVLVVVVAIGILAVLVPWAVEALGFGELGPVGGSFAAWWQCTFPDAEAGSLFSYLQRLGMKWGKV